MSASGLPLETAAAARRAPHNSGGRGGCQPPDLSALESAHQPHEAALDRYTVRPEDAGLVGRVRGFQRNRVAFPAQTLQRYFVAVHERDNDGAVLGGLAPLDDHSITIHDTGIDHRITVHLQCIVLATAEQATGNIDTLAVIAQGLDRRTGRDSPI